MKRLVAATFCAVTLAGCNGYYDNQDYSQDEHIALEEMRNNEDYVPFPIDINTARASALMTLPGLGPGRAVKICKERDKNGSYASVDDLVRRVRGITAKDLSLWEGKILFSNPKIPQGLPVDH